MFSGYCDNRITNYLRSQEYEVQHLLGKGGFACVYKAKCLHTHQDVAIKMVSEQ